MLRTPSTQCTVQGLLFARTHEATEWKTDRRGVLFTIADTGKGMSLETQKSIYKAFYTTKGAQGKGLGLWISTEIVQRHKGRLNVRSCEGKNRHGTVFQLFLPFQAAAGDLATESVEVPEGSTEGAEVVQEFSRSAALGTEDLATS